MIIDLIGIVVASVFLLLSICFLNNVKINLKSPKTYLLLASISKIQEPKIFIRNEYIGLLLTIARHSSKDVVIEEFNKTESATSIKTTKSIIINKKYIMLVVRNDFLKLLSTIK